MLVGKDGGGAVCAIHVQPEIVATADLGQSDEIIDDSGVGCAGCGYNAEGLPAGSEVVVDSLLLLGWIKLQFCIHGHSAERLAADAEQAGRLVEGMMRFRGSVNKWLASDRGDAIFDGVRKF